MSSYCCSLKSIHKLLQSGQEQVPYSVQSSIFIDSISSPLVVYVFNYFACVSLRGKKHLSSPYPLCMDNVRYG